MRSIGDFVGLPFRARGRDLSGVDCWGLVVLVYRHCLGVELPSYDDRYLSLSRAERENRASIINGEKTRWVAVAEPLPFAAALFSQGGIATHIGIVVDKRTMLHIHYGIDSVVEDFTTPKWQQRLMGFYDYA